MRSLFALIGIPVFLGSRPDQNGLLSVIKSDDPNDTRLFVRPVFGLFNGPPAVFDTGSSVSYVKSTVHRLDFDVVVSRNSVEILNYHGAQCRSTRRHEGQESLLLGDSFEFAFSQPINVVTHITNTSTPADVLIAASPSSAFAKAAKIFIFIRRASSLYTGPVAVRAMESVCRDATGDGFKYFPILSNSDEWAIEGSINFHPVVFRFTTGINMDPSLEVPRGVYDEVLSVIERVGGQRLYRLDPENPTERDFQNLVKSKFQDMGTFQYTSSIAFGSCSREILGELPTINLQFGRVPFLNLMHLAIQPKDYVTFMGSYCFISLKPAVEPSQGRVLTIDAANGIFDRVIAQFDQPKQRMGLCKAPNFPQEIFRGQKDRMRAMVRGVAEAIVHA